MATAEPWRAGPLTKANGAGEFNSSVGGFTPGQAYEYRAMLEHPKATMFGDVKQFTAR